MTVDIYKLEQVTLQIQGDLLKLWCTWWSNTLGPILIRFDSILHFVNDNYLEFYKDVLKSFCLIQFSSDTIYFRHWFMNCCPINVYYYYTCCYQKKNAWLLWLTILIHNCFTNWHINSFDRMGLANCTIPCQKIKWFNPI